jgi:hypothetical protein
MRQASRPRTLTAVARQKQHLKPAGSILASNSNRELDMKAAYAALIGLVAAVTPASAAAAGPGAVKQRVAIAAKLYPEGTFVFTPLTAGR